MLRAPRDIVVEGEIDIQTNVATRTLIGHLAVANPEHTWFRDKVAMFCVGLNGTVNAWTELSLVGQQRTCSISHLVNYIANVEKLDLAITASYYFAYLQLFSQTEL